MGKDHLNEEFGAREGERDADQFGLIMQGGSRSGDERREKKGESDGMEREARMTRVTTRAAWPPLQPKLTPMGSLIS